MLTLQKILDSYFSQWFTASLKGTELSQKLDIS